MKKKAPPTDLSEDEETSLTTTFGNAELQDDAIMGVSDLEGKSDSQEPLMESTEWSEFVMRHFAEKELDPNGHPLVHGLRRVTRLLLGPILESSVIPVQPPSLVTGLESMGFLQPAVMGYRIKLLMCRLERKFTEAYDITFTDVADVYHGNTDPDYARHPSATAATKAEARCLRKLLQLNHVSSEETTLVPTIQAGLDGKITPDTINFLNALSRRNNIDVVKFINMGTKQYKSVDDIPFGTALKMVEHLNTLQSDSTKVSADIKGYDPNWRKT